MRKLEHKISLKGPFKVMRLHLKQCICPICDPFLECSVKFLYLYHLKTQI